MTHLVSRCPNFIIRLLCRRIMYHIVLYFLIISFICVNSFHTSNLRVKMGNSMSMSSISGLSAPESEILRIGQLAARQAGAIMLAGSKEFNIDNLQQKAGDRDVLTEYDTRAQNKIKEIILNAFPSHQFLGEEDVAPGRDAAADAISKNVTASNLWIVDPIDGTTNFAHSMPLSGVIIAYAEAGIITLGIIYDPFHDEMFVAFKGKGAYFQRKQYSC